MRNRMLGVARKGRDLLSRALIRAAATLRLGIFLRLDYPPSANPGPRLGGAEHASPLLFDWVASGRGAYRQALVTIVEFRTDLQRIKLHGDDPSEPSWINGYLPALDSAAIYGFLRARRPALYLEVGSGNSTRFAARAKHDGRLETEIISIDPMPRAEVDDLCNEVIRSPLESVDVALFERLSKGDIVFFDGSHRVFTNSDATVFFLELMPTFPPGVLVGIHDVYLPYDYPAEIGDRHYSEQYLLAAYLLGGAAGVKPELACEYVRRDSRLTAVLAPLWDDPRFQDVETHGSAFWLTTSDR